MLSGGVNEKLKNFKKSYKNLIITEIKCKFAVIKITTNINLL